MMSNLPEAATNLDHTIIHDTFNIESKGIEGVCFSHVNFHTLFG
jgi:hypothetical protein